MFSQIGMPEILVVLVIALLVFGAKRLPEMGSSLGKGIREFKRSLTDVRESIDTPDEQTKTPRTLDGPAARDGEPKKLSQ